MTHDCHTDQGRDCPACAAISRLVLWDFIVDCAWMTLAGAVVALAFIAFAWLAGSAL